MESTPPNPDGLAAKKRPHFVAESLTGPEAPVPAPPLLGDVSKWELGVTGTASFTSVTQLVYTGGPLRIAVPTSRNGGSGELSVSRFIRPVHDDDAPRSLQPFLQSAGSVSLGVAVGGYSVSPLFQGVPVQSTIGGRQVIPNDTEIQTQSAIAIDAYVSEHWALTGGLVHAFDLRTFIGGSRNSHALAPGAGLGYRFGDVRFDLSYSNTATSINGSFVPPTWGTLVLQYRQVFRRRISLVLAALAYERGAGGRGDVEGFVNKDVGLFLGSFGRVARRYSDIDVVHNDYGVHAGAGLWAAPFLRIVLQYELSGSTVPLPQPNGSSSSTRSTLSNEPSVAAIFRL